MSTSGSFLQSLFDFLARLFGASPAPTPAPPQEDGILQPLNPRVLLIIYNPLIDASAGKRMVKAMGWNDPDQLVADYIADVRECSQNLVTYQVVDRVEVDEFPKLIDGFQYDAATYVQLVQGKAPPHVPGAIDYLNILAQFNTLSRVANNEIDEVWVMAFPFAGLWESAMAGRGAFFCNGGPIDKTSQCPRRFVVMGFNFERGVGEMLEDLGHRAETVLAHVFGSENFWQWAYTRGRSPATTAGTNLNLLERFLCFDQIAPGKANIGTMHYAPNSQTDYEWGVTTPVSSCADDWKQFPTLPEPPSYRAMDTREWGGGDIRAHHKWWLAHLPKVAGVTNGVANNWWKYFADPNTVK